MSEALETRYLPAEDIQQHIQNHFEALKADMVKFEETQTEYHKIRYSNDLLRRELEAEKAASAKLSQHMKDIHERDENLKIHTARLETELSEWRRKARDRSSISSELDPEVEALRETLRKAETELQLSHVKLDCAEQLRQSAEDEAAKSKVGRIATSKCFTLTETEISRRASKKASSVSEESANGKGEGKYFILQSCNHIMLTYTAVGRW